MMVGRIPNQLILLKRSKVNFILSLRNTNVKYMLAGRIPHPAPKARYGSIALVGEFLVVCNNPQPSYPALPRRRQRFRPYHKSAGLSREKLLRGSFFV